MSFGNAAHILTVWRELFPVSDPNRTEPKKGLVVRFSPIAEGGTASRFFLFSLIRHRRRACLLAPSLSILEVLPYLLQSFFFVCDSLIPSSYPFFYLQFFTPPRIFNRATPAFPEDFSSSDSPSRPRFQKGHENPSCSYFSSLAKESPAQFFVSVYLSLSRQSEASSGRVT